MSTSLQVPDSLTQQLKAYRDRIWTTKVAEAILFGVVGLLISFLAVYALDRFFDTSQGMRFTIFLTSLCIWLMVPWAMHRWVWRNRRLDQLARLLRIREPSVGDQLLSVIELSQDYSEQARSRTLCAAAIAQVAEVAKTKNFNNAAPPTYLKGLSITLGISGVIAVALMLFFPVAAANAWSRFLAPWKETPRYTFTAVESLSDRMVVPHGETTVFKI